MYIQKIFENLQGIWYFTRTLQSKYSDFPSGIVKGQAIFGPKTENTLYYKEFGVFTTTRQKTFKINKEYLYRYNPDEGTIEKYFIDNKSNRLFYQLKFEKTGSTAKSCFAAGKHLCKEDNYTAHYEFSGDNSLDIFKLNYAVKGPQKDYLAETLYIREQ